MDCQCEPLLPFHVGVQPGEAGWRGHSGHAWFNGVCLYLWASCRRTVFLSQLGKGQLFLIHTLSQGITPKISKQFWFQSQAGLQSRWQRCGKITLASRNWNLIAGWRRWDQCCSGRSAGGSSIDTGNTRHPSDLRLCCLPDVFLLDEYVTTGGFAECWVYRDLCKPCGRLQGSCQL